MSNINKEINCSCGNKIKLDIKDAVEYNGENFYHRWVCEKCGRIYQHKPVITEISLLKD